jgi:hypothetical protein
MSTDKKEVFLFSSSLIVIKIKPYKLRPKLYFELADSVSREASLLLILKWGGELTPSGRRQAEELGKVFRCMYPGGQGNSVNPLLTFKAFKMVTR